MRMPFIKLPHQFSHCFFHLYWIPLLKKKRKVSKIEGRSYFHSSKKNFNIALHTLLFVILLGFLFSSLFKNAVTFTTAVVSSHHWNFPFLFLLLLLPSKLSTSSVFQCSSRRASSSASLNLLARLCCNFFIFIIKGACTSHITVSTVSARLVHIF